MSKSLAAFAVLIGTIVGAGILGLPHVINKSGFLPGAFLIVVIGFIIMWVNLYLGEITLRTKSTHQLPGYAEKYIGKTGKKLMFIVMAFGIFSAILAYIIAEGRSLSYLIFNSPAYEFQLGILFWIFLSFITYFGIKALEGGEIVGVTFISIMVISITIYFYNKIDLANLGHVFPGQLFTPIGVILFSLLGFAAIPVVKRVLGKEKSSMRKTIIYVYMAAIIIYILFTAIVIGFKGELTPEVATIALGKPFILLGMLTIFTAYLSLTIAMIDTIRFDFKKSRITAWMYTISIPLILFIILSVIEKTAFTKILGIGGAVSGGLTAILIMAMVKNAKRKGKIKPSYSMPHSGAVTWAITLLALLAIFLEFKRILQF